MTSSLLAGTPARAATQPPRWHARPPLDARRTLLVGEPGVSEPT